jgi:hypothetical protein
MKEVILLAITQVLFPLTLGEYATMQECESAAKVLSAAYPSDENGIYLLCFGESGRRKAFRSGREIEFPQFPPLKKK